MKSLKSQKGYIALITILIIGAVGVTIAVSLLTASIGKSKSSNITNYSQKAEDAAYTCSEEALRQIKTDPSYTGNYNLNLGDDISCNYNIIDLGSENREIQSQGSYQQVTKKVEVSIDQINPQINISLWQEVPDF